MLISSVGWINALIGFVFVGFGIYVLFAGADAVATLFQMRTEVGKAAHVVAGKEGAEQAREAAGIFAQGFSGVILAFAAVFAGCSIVQGLPNLLVGVGVILRSNLARVFAFVFAVLALFEGLACLSATGQSSRFLYAGLFLIAYAMLTFVALLGKRATFEFSGGLKSGADAVASPSANQAMTTEVSPRTDSTPTSAKSTSSAALFAMAVLLAIACSTAATFATLYFTRQAADPTLVQFPWPGANPGDGKKIPPIDDTRTLALHKPKLAAFHDAVLAGQVPRAAELLREVDVDEPDEVGRTALMKVAATGNLRMTLFVLAMGAQLNQRDKEGKTAFMYAVDKDQRATMGILRGEGNSLAEMAALRAKYNDPSKGGLTGNFKDLLAGRFDLPPVDLSARDNRGQTAFMQAIVKGHIDAADQFRHSVSRDDLEDAEGNTILHLLAAGGNTSLVRRFDWVPKGAPSPGWYFSGFRSGTLNQTNRAGRTAWMLAAEKGHLDIVKHLLANPPRDDVQLKDKSGKTGLDLALANNHQDVVAYLTQLQQDVPAKGAAKDKTKN